MKDLRWLGHSGFIIFGEKKIYIDPYQLEQGVLPKADIILITHSHEDHFSLKDIEDIAGNNTVIVGPKEIEGKTRKLTIKKFELMLPIRFFHYVTMKKYLEQTDRNTPSPSFETKTYHQRPVPYLNHSKILQQE